ncbi:MAG TPA: hypothetical protein DD714_06595 [Candidatus Omnitrophica bacterium]|nr:hypothetical protein [Candidatus Omnitrophota bacterium]
MVLARRVFSQLHAATLQVQPSLMFIDVLLPLNAQDHAVPAGPARIGCRSLKVGISMELLLQSVNLPPNQSRPNRVGGFCQRWPLDGSGRLLGLRRRHWRRPSG